MTRNDAAQPIDSAATIRKVLMLTPQFPYPPHQGTTMRNYNLIAGLAQRQEVHLLSFGQPEESQGTPLERFCRSVQVVRPPQRSAAQRLRGLFLSRQPDMALRLPSTEFRAALTALLERETPDVVEVEGIELAQYLFQVAAERGDARRPAAYSFVQWKRLKGYERRACQAADRVVVVSEPDAEALRRLEPGLEPAVVPNGVDMDYYTAPVTPLPPGSGPGEQDLVFTGKMDFRPNVDAVLWFAREVLPLVRQRSPQTRFWVVGKDPHPRLASVQADPAVVVTGWVEDVRPYIAAAGVYVIPLRIGGGTRLKVLEAMAMGRAIVSTALGCEGFPLVPDQELVIADEPAGFATAVLDLLDDAERRERMGRAARRFAGSRYDWRNIVPRLERVYTLSGR